MIGVLRELSAKEGTEIFLYPVTVNIIIANHEFLCFAFLEVKINFVIQLQVKGKSQWLSITCVNSNHSLS